LRWRGEWERAPVSTEENGCRADVEENDSIPGTDVVVDSPADSVGRFIGEVNRDADLAAGTSGGSGGV
jgi:hypothetical protein